MARGCELQTGLGRSHPVAISGLIRSLVEERVPGGEIPMPGYPLRVEGLDKDQALVTRSSNHAWAGSPAIAERAAQALWGRGSRRPCRSNVSSQPGCVRVP